MRDPLVEQAPANIGNVRTLAWRTNSQVGIDLKET